MQWGPLQGKSRGGESERGRKGASLGEGPLTFGIHFGHILGKVRSQKCVENTVVTKMPKCAKNVAQGAQRDAKSDQNGAKSGPNSA